MTLFCAFTESSITQFGGGVKKAIVATGCDWAGVGETTPRGSLQQHRRRRRIAAHVSHSPTEVSSREHRSGEVRCIVARDIRSPSADLCPSKRALEQATRLESIQHRTIARHYNTPLERLQRNRWKRASAPHARVRDPLRSRLAASAGLLRHCDGYVRTPCGFDLKIAALHERRPRR